MSQPSPQDAKLFFEQQMDCPVSHDIAGGCAVVFSARSPARDTPNEDAAALIPFNTGAAVLAVADGLGGLQAGEVAAQMTIETIRSALAQVAPDTAQMRGAILNGIEHANQAVQDLEVGAATTLALAEIDYGAVRPYHVGDSMILVTGQRGALKLQTVSHSPVGFAVEAGLLDETEAMFHEDRHIVSNVIGTAEMRVEVGSVLKLALYDTLLLASDGLFDNLHTAEIVEIMCNGPLEQAATQLADEARRRMTRPDDKRPSKPDDLTFVLYRRQRPARGDA